MDSYQSGKKNTDTTCGAMPSEARDGDIGCDVEVSISWFRLLCFMCSPFCHIYDTFSDIKSAKDYFTDQEIAYGCITLTFIGLSGAGSLLISSMMNHRKQRQTEKENEQIFSCRRGDFLFAMINVLFDLRLLWHYWKRFRYAMNVKLLRKSKMSGKIDEAARISFDEELEKKIENLSVLCLMPSFIENVPQLTVQLAGMVQKDKPIGYLMWIRMTALIFVAVDSQAYYLYIYSGRSRRAVLNKWYVFRIWLQCYISIVCWISATTFIVCKCPIYILLFIVFIWMIWAIYIYKVNCEIKELFSCRNKASSWSAWRDVALLFCCAFLALVHMFTFLDFKNMCTFVRMGFKILKVQTIQNPMPLDQDMEGWVDVSNRYLLEEPEANFGLRLLGSDLHSPFSQILRRRYVPRVQLTAYKKIVEK
ncbi:uncharacterized protein LOC124299672 [Neodiprion virginianus]|uniref:uncharacterized protein LOC124299672 n=1 Tax=Neodiprion virginianus TaxID=2961670 RepID=UPI001EE74EAF|nr:uncharacterized protein LOC124299672 [Neodiprion virginianus]